MFKFIKKISRDSIGIYKVLGFRYTYKWLINILKNIPTILKEGNLQKADLAMGAGPFSINMPNVAQFKVFGDHIFSGIREMYVRDTYLKSGLLTIADGDLVIDLGANIGNFTNLALSFGDKVKVISIEPNLKLNKALRESVNLNPGYLDRVTLIRAFIGELGEKQDEMMMDEAYSTAKYITEREIITNLQIKKIDFLKCDIEGGEFGLLNENSQILKITQKIAIEVHQFAGDVKNFIEMLRTAGFRILSTQIDPDGTSTILGTREKLNPVNG